MPDKTTGCPECDAEIRHVFAPKNLAGEVQYTVTQFRCLSAITAEGKRESFRRSDECRIRSQAARIAQLTAEAAELRAEVERLKINGCCPACHEPLEGVGYSSRWNNQWSNDPVVVFECKCGRQWTAVPPIRRSEYMATAALSEQPVQGEERQ